MKKLLITVILVFMLFLFNVKAYLNCTPGSCLSGYTDRGLVCQGSQCIRNCTVAKCLQDWTIDTSDTSVGFNGAANEATDTSSTHPAQDVTACYNYTYEGSTSSADTEMNVNGSEAPDCDTESIGGFWDVTNGADHSNPWFATIGGGGYLGTTPGDNEFNYLYKIMRASTEGSDDPAYRTATQTGGKINCAPTTQACAELSGQCNQACYGKSTLMMVEQGYYVEFGAGRDASLYHNDECGTNSGGSDYVQDNKLLGTNFKVYKSHTFNQTTDLTLPENANLTCDMTHEAPNVSGVTVLPLVPNAGQDLLCNYTYSDPENWTEQNSSFEWWKNSVNQNFNDQTLSRFNLTPGDQWFCKVTPSDGMLFGTQTQSSNIVTIKNATNNTRMYVGNQAVWNNSGYFGNEVNVFDFNQALDNELSICVADAQGFCNISLTFNSNNPGVINLSKLEIYYNDDSTTSISVSLTIESLTLIYSNDTLKIFKFVILNDGESTVTDIQWQFDTGNNNIINSTLNISSLAPNQRAFVYLKYNYTDFGNYNLNVNATGISQSTNVFGSLSSALSIGELNIISFGNFVQGKNSTFKIKAKNFLTENIGSINWTLDTGNNYVINSTLPFNLTSNQTIFIFSAYNYTSTGSYMAMSTIKNGSLQDTESLNVNI